jgi:ferredoxin, 2Fe-2S
LKASLPGNLFAVTLRTCYVTALTRENQVATLNVRDRLGALHRLEAEPGRTIMELLRDEGLGIEALCGGQGACATCHCYIESDAAGSLPTPSNDEIDLLGILECNVPGRSRLTCQLLMQSDWPDLTITIAPEG